MALNSQTTLKIIDLLCEGPIEGIVGNRKGVFVNETPLKSGGKENVSRSDVSHNFRFGTRGQSTLPEAGNKVENLINVAQEIGENYSERTNSKNQVKTRNYGSGKVVRSVTNPDVEKIDLIFTVPRLFSTAQEGLARGQLFDATIFFDIAIQGGGRGPFERIEVDNVNTSADLDSQTFGSKYQFRIQGISTTNYQFIIKGIKLSDFGTAPWNIRVRKYPLNYYAGDLPHTTGRKNKLNSLSQKIDSSVFEASYKDFEDTDKDTPLANGRANQLIWSAIVERQTFRSGYPYCAVVGMDISNEFVTSLPTRAYKIRGKKVRIPGNVNEVREDGSLEFLGEFTGELDPDLHYTTCPICIFYDLLTNTRYGAGNFIDESNLSWVDLYPLARYCNELINLEDGDQEPRFACNVVVSSQQEAFNVLQDFASIFRGMIYWNTNTIQLAADHGNLGGGGDYSPVHLFTNSNVIEGIFNYSGSSLKTRSTSVKVRYNDPDNFYRPDVVCVEDSALIEKYGYQRKEITAFGCTSKTQALRVGRWMLLSEEANQETVTFSVGLDGAVVLPGQVFAISDEMRAGTRLSGRIQSSTTTSIVGDQSITLPTGTSPELTCILQSGEVQTKTIASVGGATVNVSTAFSSAPLVGSVYSITTSNVRNQKFRCLSVADNSDGTYSIVAVEFNESIYDAVDLDRALEFTDTTTLDAAPPIPII